MSSTQAEHVLDNPVWHTLNSHHAHIASGTALVKRYPTDVSITSAIADHSDVAINDLTQLVASGEIIGLLQSPAKNVVSALQSGGNTLAGLVKTLQERG